MVRQCFVQKNESKKISIYKKNILKIILNYTSILSIGKIEYIKGNYVKRIHNIL